MGTAGSSEFPPCSTAVLVTFFLTRLGGQGLSFRCQLDATYEIQTLLFFSFITHFVYCVASADFVRPETPAMPYVHELITISALSCHLSMWYQILHATPGRLAEEELRQTLAEAGTCLEPYNSANFYCKGRSDGLAPQTRVD